MSILKTKTSEAGFREMFELEYQRKMNSNKHKKKLETIKDDSKELREYV